MKTTIRDIAKIANVSTTTVSRILNGKYEGMSEATRERVLDAIKENNYKPSTIARSLVTNKTRTLGLTLPSISNPFFSNLARGVEDYAIKRGYNLFLCNTDDEKEKQKLYFEALIEKGVDGIISATYYDDQEECFRDILNQKVPFIILDKNYEEGMKYRSSIDNYSGAYSATDYLIQNGHKKIACIRGPLNSPFSRERFRGYKEALENSHIEVDEKVILEGDFFIDSGEKCALEILKNSEVTAIVCFNDFMAFGAYKACRKLNKRIPEDISITGFDDIELSTIIEPHLTTVKQPIYELGFKTAGLIIDLIEKREPEIKHIKLDTELIIRDSVMKIKP